MPRTQPTDSDWVSLRSHSAPKFEKRQLITKKKRHRISNAQRKRPPCRKMGQPYKPEMGKEAMPIVATLIFLLTCLPQNEIKILQTQRTNRRLSMTIKWDKQATIECFVMTF